MAYQFVRTVWDRNRKDPIHIEDTMAVLYIFIVLAILWLIAAYMVLVHTDSNLIRKPVPVMPKGPIVSERSEDVATKDEEPPSERSLGCIWPPVTAQGEFPCGFDMLPLLNIKVPKFWTPPDDEFPSWRSYMNGEETIFIMIASYRDFQCRETIASALSRARHPERLFIGAVDQVVPGDIGCLDLEVPCTENHDQLICKHKDQISLYKMDAKEATGPVTARHIGDRMYRGQHFSMQLDAHCQFVRDWDVKLVDQWKSTKNEMAVLT